MRQRSLIPCILLLVVCCSLQAKAALIVQLAKAGNFGVLAATTVTNTGASVISGGNLGVSPGSSITGFPPGVVLAPSIRTGEDRATSGQNDLTTAYRTAKGLAPGEILSGRDLGGLTLRPGVYFFATTADLAGTLTLDDNNNPNAEFVFQIGTTLTTGSHSSVVTINSASTPGSNVYWQVGSSATLDAHTAFEGHILADTSVTMKNLDSVEGSVLARHGAVTLIADSITNSGSAVSPASLSNAAITVPTNLPEPATMGLVLIGGAILGLGRRGRSARAIV